MDQEMKDALDLMTKVGTDVEGLLSSQSEFKTAITTRLDALEGEGNDAAVGEVKTAVDAVATDLTALKQDVATIRESAMSPQLEGEFIRSGIVMDAAGLKRLTAVERMPTKVRDACAQYMQALILAGTQKHMQSGKTAGHLQKMENIRAEMGADFVKAVPPLNEAVAAEGLDLVPTPFEAVLRRQLEDAAVVRPLATVIPMTALTHQFPKFSTAPVASWVAEGVTIPDSWSAGPFGQDDLTAKKLGCLTDVSGELAQDNAVALMQFIGVVFGEAAALAEDVQALEGDGTVFTGLSDATGVNEIVAAGAQGDLITYAKLVAMVYKGVKRVSRRKAAFFMHPRDIEQIVALEDSAGAPLLNRTDIARVISESLVGGEGMGEGTILGFPVFSSDGISIARTKGTSTDCSNVYFGPMDSFNMIYGDLLGWEVESSDQHNLNFAKWLITVRAFKRVGILVGVPANFTRMIDVNGANSV